MKPEQTQMNSEKQERPKTAFATSAERRVEEVDKGAVLGTLVLVGIGAFAVKKLWDWKGAEVKKQASPVVNEAIDRVLNKAKKRLFEAIDPAFQDGETSGEKPISKPEDANRKSGDKRVFEANFSGLGVDVQGAAEGKKEAVFNDTFLGKLQRQEERFGALADEDPAFAAEMNYLSLQSQEEIMSFVRNLDPDTRGKISLAFLSGNLEASEEAVTNINEKTRPFETVPLEGLGMDELYDLANKIVEAEDRKGGKHELYEYFRREIQIIPSLKQEGDEFIIDNITAGFSAHKSARSEELAEIIRSAVGKYAEDKPDGAKMLGITSGERAEQEVDGSKPDRMKEEYRRLLKERYTVQKVTLKIMADFLRAKK
ncbi:MAG: hypothetical protein EXS50_02845 [Candidatus Taylorbacteria bacterium]|nr:hypothetical protein [Candidatus Taylorbacteria bacterium]